MHAQWSVMDRNSIIALLLYRHRKLRRNRLHWVHLIIKKREEFGAFTRYLMNYELTQRSFFNHFRKLVASFDELHSRQKESLQHRDSKMRNCIQPVEMLAVAVT